MRTVVVAVLAGLLLAPGGALAAPVPIGDGHKPGVAVDAAGTAYIAWYGAETGDTSLRFCRLARGATACAGQSTIATSGSSLTRPFVLVSGATVRVLQHRFGAFADGFNQLIMFTSADGGKSFDGGVPVGYVPFDEAVAGPGDTVSVATNAYQEGGIVQNVPLSGGSAGQARAGLFGTDVPHNGTVGLVGDGRPVAVFAAGDSQAQFRLYNGAGDLNDAANWGPPTVIGYADYPKLAGGPAGLFMLHGTEDGGLLVRRWSGATFPLSTEIGTGDDAQASLAQDTGGRLHALWPRGEGDGFHLVYATSDDGSQWDTTSIVVQSDAIAQTRVAAAPDHVGVAVWESATQIRVEAIGPQPEFHKSVVLRSVSGKVRVKLKGASRFVDLSAIDDVPLGSTVDTKRGRVELASVPSRTGAVEKVELYDGIFRVAQKGSITEFALNESLASCRRARAAAKKPKTRKLWGDGKGRFRTKGQYSAATVRGTKWLVQDSCAGTLTRVTQGSVVVRAGRRSIVVRAGKRYLARPR